VNITGPTGPSEGTEGNWTPSLGGTTTYTLRWGRYKQIGNWIYAQGAITVNALGTGSVNTISGLPAVAYSGSNQAGNVGQYASLATAVSSLSCYVISNTATLQFCATTGNQATTTDSVNIFGNSASVYFEITYYIGT
jgi:hypothetical protein